MKKHLTFIVLAVSLIMAVLPGCKKDDDTNPLIGSWQYTYEGKEKIGEVWIASTFTDTYTFKEGGMLELKTYGSASETTESEKGTYYVEGNVLTLSFSGEEAEKVKYKIKGDILSIYWDEGNEDDYFEMLLNRVK